MQNNFWCNNWKSYNHTRSKTESKEAKSDSFYYRKVGRNITRWGAIRGIMSTFRRGRNIFIRGRSRLKGTNTFFASSNNSAMGHNTQEGAEYLIIANERLVLAFVVPYAGQKHNNSYSLRVIFRGEHMHMIWFVRGIWPLCPTAQPVSGDNTEKFNIAIDILAENINN